jgi:[ribosomal protein S5]-alanine N-acetyltransferase
MTTSPAVTFEWLDETHADALYEGFSDLQVSQFTAEKLLGSLEDMRREFADFQAGAPPGRQEIWMNWVIRETRSQALVGTLQATLFADGALWIGYKLIRSAWGRGIATTAVKWLLQELAPHYAGRTVLAAADSRNHASLRVLQKCGFTHVRTEPANIRGEPTVDHIYEFVLPLE